MNLNRRRNWFDHSMAHLEKAWYGKVLGALIYLALCAGMARIGYAYFFE